MTDNDRPKPKFEDAPGVVINPAAKGQWEARWQCRTDILAGGFKPASRRLWVGLDPTELQRAAVSDLARRLQREMLIFGGGGLPDAPTSLDGTLRGLIRVYQIDKDSSFHKLRYQVRQNYVGILRRLEQQHGDVLLQDVKARVVLAWHTKWSESGVAMARTFIGMLRTIVGFGATFLEDEQCIRLKGVLSGMRFKTPKPRTVHLTAAMAERVIDMANQVAWHSIALAQALQFELTLRQKDIIGEYVPLREPGVSDITWGGKKWLYGLRWSEIDQNMILRHTTSKTGKELEVDLRNAPMVLRELDRYKARHGDLPTTGAIVICERTGYPWLAQEWRRKWRLVATNADVPKNIRNMDTRAGAITEATEAGAPIEHVKHAATHADIGMTQRYSRNAADKISNVMQLRSAHRNKPKTDD